MVHISSPWAGVFDCRRPTNRIWFSELSVSYGTYVVCRIHVYPEMFYVDIHDCIRVLIPVLPLSHNSGATLIYLKHDLECLLGFSS